MSQCPFCRPPPLAAAPPEGGLEIVLGAEKGRRYVLGATALTIGRSAECQVVLSDPLVSQQHAWIAQQGGQLVLVDLGSSNGTFVGERRVDRHPLRDGDAIQIGSTRLVVRIPA